MNCEEKCVYTAWKIPTKNYDFDVRLHHRGSVCDTDAITNRNRDDAISQLKKDFEFFLDNIDSIRHFEIFVNLV